MPILETKNVYKTFDNNIEVLNDINLTIEQGDFVSIVGASGSGKSTLLTILGGIDKPSSGEVICDNQNITMLKEKDLAKLRRTKIGFVFQFFNLAPNLTVTENVLLPIILDNQKISNFSAKLDKLFAYLGISHLKDRLPSKLSGGEQQRVAIARGLIFDPKVILLDEPTGNLDSKNSLEIMKLLVNVNKDINTTIVQVTHSKENSAYGNKIISIKDGKIVEL